MLRILGHSTLALFALLLCAAPTIADDGHLLRYKFRPGMFIHLKITDKMQIEAKFNANVEKHANKALTWKHYRVISADERGQAVLETLNERVSMELKFGEHPAVNFDTANPGDSPDPKFQAVLASTGKPLARTEVTSRGELVKLTPLVTDIPGAPEASNFLVVFPEEPVLIGGKWKESFDTPVTVGKNLQQNFSLMREYTLVSVEGNLAHIKMRVGPKGVLNDPQMEMQLMQRLITSDIVFDMSRGLIVSQRNTVDRNVVNPLGPGSQVSAVGDYRLELTDGPAAVQQAAAGTKSETK